MTSVIVSDPKCEDVCPHINYNCFAAAINAYHSGKTRKEVSSYIRGHAEIVAPEPDKDAQNPFFRNNGYRAFEILLGDLIVEIEGHLTYKDVLDLLKRIDSHDAICPDQ